MRDLAIKKPSTADRIVQWIASKEGDTPVQLTPKQEEHWKRVSFADDMRRQGYATKDVVKQLQTKFGVSQNTAYIIVRDTERVFGQLGVNKKDYMRVVVEDFILQGMRKALAKPDLKAVERFTAQLIKIHGLDIAEGETVPANVLERHVVYLVANPEDVGMTTYSKEEMEEFYKKLTGEEAPKTIDITAEDVTG